MPGRIITLQRQARELGRLRAGLTATTVKNGREITYPTSSKTWILTSSQRDYLDTAAQLWGGTVAEWEPQGGGPKAWRLITEQSAIDAILPPGDPLSQSYELWSKGGCQRRCDGEQEQRSGEACLCRAQFGEDFHEQKQGTVCDIHTRLSVILPDLPDIGVWRVETKGYWAANKITATVDLVKAQVGSQVLIPIRLWIEPKKRVVDGKTSLFTEIMLGVRGGITFGQVLAGQLPDLAVAGGPERPALESGPTAPAVEPTIDTARTAEQFKTLANLARDPATIRSLWNKANAAGVLDDDLKAHMKARAADLGAEAKPNANGQPAEAAEAAQPTGAPPAPVEVVEGEPEPDVTAVLMQILAVAGGKPLQWSSADLERRVHDRFGAAPDDIDGWQAQTFLDELKNGQVS